MRNLFAFCLLIATPFTFHHARADYRPVCTLAYPWGVAADLAYEPQSITDLLRAWPKTREA